MPRLLTITLPSRPDEFHVEPLTEPDLTLSRHPARATARRLPPSVEQRAPPGEPEFVWNHLRQNGVTKKPLKKNEKLKDRVKKDLATRRD